MTLQQLIIGIIISVPIGGVVSLPILLPPLRKMGRRSKAVRTAAILIFGLVSFVIILGLGMRFSAEWIYLSAPRPAEANGQLKSLIVDELWMRKVMPPPLRRSCYTGQTTVCNLTDAVISAYYGWYYPDSAKSEKTREQEEYWGTAFMGLVSGLTSGTIVWFLTGKAQPVQAA